MRSPVRRHFSPEARSRGALLESYRAKYRWQVHRSHSLQPDPTTVPVELYGHFARVPSKAGDVWFFESQGGRDKFLKRYGGQAIDG